MTLTAQEVAARLYEHNRWRRGFTEQMEISPSEIGFVIDAAIELLNRHPTERIHIDDTKSRLINRGMN